MNFRTLIMFFLLAFTLTGCKTSGLKRGVEPVTTDNYKVWVEPSYAKSLRKLNGPTVRYQTIEIPRPDLLASQGVQGEE